MNDGGAPACSYNLEHKDLTLTPHATVICDPTDCKALKIMLSMNAAFFLDQADRVCQVINDTAEFFRECEESGYFRIIGDVAVE